jgi:hypothetical protein
MISPGVTAAAEVSRPLIDSNLTCETPEHAGPCFKRRDRPALAAALVDTPGGGDPGQKAATPAAAGCGACEEGDEDSPPVGLQRRQCRALVLSSGAAIEAACTWQLHTLPAVRHTSQGFLSIANSLLP